RAASGGLQYFEGTTQPRNASADDVEPHPPSGDGARLRSRRKAGMEDELRDDFLDPTRFVTEQAGVSCSLEDRRTIETRSVVADLDPDLISLPRRRQSHDAHLVFPGASSHGRRLETVVHGVPNEVQEGLSEGVSGGLVELDVPADHFQPGALPLLARQLADECGEGAEEIAERDQSEAGGGLP